MHILNFLEHPRVTLLLGILVAMLLFLRLPWEDRSEEGALSTVMPSTNLAGATPRTGPARLGSMPAVQEFDVSGDLRVAAVVTDEGARVWDVERGRIVWETDERGITCLALDHHGYWIAYGRLGTVYVANRMNTAVLQYDVTFPSRYLNRQAIWDIAFRPHAQEIAACGQTGGRSYVVRLSIQRHGLIELERTYSDRLTSRCLAFRPDGRMLAVGRSRIERVDRSALPYDAYRTRMETLRTHGYDPGPDFDLRRTVSSVLLRREVDGEFFSSHVNGRSLTAPHALLRQVQFSADGALLAAQSARAVTVWDVSTGSVLQNHEYLPIVDVDPIEDSSPFGRWHAKLPRLEDASLLPNRSGLLLLGAYLGAGSIRNPLYVLRFGEGERHQVGGNLPQRLLGVVGPYAFARGSSGSIVRYRIHSH